MVRAPCCEKMGLKKGPWTREEDHILITYINQHGHGNWRALPKKAGLLRCGKSCRLRWINYLRPDLKRGNFSNEEEDTIIQLHEVLGNRWSAIAARLPGRTDNEIKNVWHTHLKKRLVKQAIPETQNKQIETAKFDHDSHVGEDSRTFNLSMPESSESIHCQPNSPSHSYSSSDVSSSITTPTNPENAEMFVITDDLHSYTSWDEDFWLDVVSSEHSGKFSGEDGPICFPLSPLHPADGNSSFNSNTHDDMDFWSDLFTRAEEQLLQLPDF